MKVLLVLFCLVLVFVVLAAVAAKGKRGAIGKGVKVPLLATKPAVMDKWEAELYERLVVALEACHVFPQVAMSAFVKEAKRGDGSRNFFRPRESLHKSLADVLARVSSASEYVGHETSRPWTELVDQTHAQA
ncbi:hypothetical protein [Ralstonia pseudosolanacearum]|uniref:hypothetical protein n=1 Tax=Ralstonia pseudosolanacearum TaxID=1310165 RepID=UPI0018D16A42|nr:hypothetical protein [Ralstonia pseudosolanacearum]